MPRWVFVIAVVLVAAAGTFALTLSRSPQTGCTHEGLLGPNGEAYGRSNERGCQFVNTDGELARYLRTGELICYGDDTAAIVPCGHPDARRPA